MAAGGSTLPAAIPETLQPQVPPALDVLRSAALVLFGIFLVSVVLRSLPLRLLEPLWQVSFVTSVIDMGGYAILGVVVLLTAHLLAPRHEALWQQFRRVAWLSRFAALGYLLLVPLLISALVRDYDLAHKQQLRQLQLVSETERRGAASLRAATSRTELLRAVQGFNAQALPSLLIEEEAPLASLRRSAQDLLRRNVAAARAQFGQSENRGLRWILFNNLRLILLALLFAFGFSTACTGLPSFPLLGALYISVAWLWRLVGGARSPRPPQYDDQTDQDPDEGVIP
jgi:hypothetical protein